MTALIWDLDGTLIDSYDAIMAALEVVYRSYCLEFKAEDIRQFILQESVGALLSRLAEQEGLDESALKMLFSQEQRKRDHQIQLMPFAKAILDWTKEQAISNFIYTHKGPSASQVLENLGIADYFTEVLTSQSGFKRKPSPEALHYLMAKYNLDRKTTYYIGDRSLDVQAAKSAGIGSINLTQEGGTDNHKIANLKDIKGLLLGQR